MYVDIWDGFVDEGGSFAVRGPISRGRPAAARQGRHAFTQAGARKLAHYVEREMRRVMSNRTEPRSRSRARTSGRRRKRPSPAGKPSRPWALSLPAMPAQRTGASGRRGSPRSRRGGGDQSRACSDAAIPVRRRPPVAARLAWPRRRRDREESRGGTVPAAPPPDFGAASCCRSKGRARQSVVKKPEKPEPDAKKEATRDAAAAFAARFARGRRRRYGPHSQSAPQHRTFG